MPSGKIKKIQKFSAVQQAVESLKAVLYQIDARGEQRLPSEEELALKLGISRLTIREALAVLESDGFISRIQGKGNILNPFVQRLTSRIDTSREIDGFLEDKGYSTSAKLINYQWRKADKYEASKLCIDEGDELLVVEKIFMADLIPATFYIDRIPRKLFINEDFDKNDLEKSMFTLVENLCECRITHDVLEIIPTVTDKKLSSIFNIKTGTPILRLDVLEYISNGTPIMFNSEYYHDKFIRFTVCRNVDFTS